MPTPYLIALMAVSCYAMLGPIAKKVSAELPPFAFIAISSFLLFAVCSALSVCFERGAFTSSARLVSWKWLLVFSAINICGYVGYLWAINRIPVAHYQMCIVFSPLIGGIFAVYLLGESFSSRYVLAAAIMAVGLFVAIQPKLPS